MKNGLHKLMLFISAFLMSCNTNNTGQRNENNYKLINYPEQCFMAIYQKDSAFLKFKAMPNGKIRGKLTIKYAEPQLNDLEKEFYHGEIIGQFKKDTLFADYIFTDGTKSTTYKNPIALLKKNQKLILGSGAIVNYVGKSWFMNHKAINFETSRFQFLPGECKN